MSNGKGKSFSPPTIEDLLQSYPSLHRCILIDARHASRTEIVKDLKTSLLFEVASEAKSLEDGLTILQYEEIDACFLGPSVTLPNAVKFLKRARADAKSKDCAYIVMVNRLDEKAEDNEAVLREAGVDGVIKRPCTKIVLADGVVRAVVKANGSGAWADLFLKSGHSEMTIADAFIMKKPAGVANAAGQAVPPNPPEPTPLEALIEKAIHLTLAKDQKLNSLCVGINNGEFRLDPAGHPTVRTLEEIKHLIDETLPELELDDRFLGFSEFLNDALQKWVIDQINTTSEVADRKLSAYLRSYGKAKPSKS